MDLCPCPDHAEANFVRLLQNASSNSTNGTADNGDADTAEEPVKIWEVVYMCVVLLIMFVALLSDRIGADMVMVLALTLCMASGIITVNEGIAGFANSGILTVMVLFIVAAGISLTGGLDWYMGKLLGRPRITASAQLRLMVPIGVVSAFLNNTPVVAVMIPIVQRWGRNIGISPQQLLIPLSFASILGGTCTLIGTSTNLVVIGLLDEKYGDDAPDIGLFDLGVYGVPVAFAGVAYILLASPFLLPGSKKKGGGAEIALPDEGESILLGARLTKWSPAAGRSVQRSGLRDTGGIYLVSVHRAATGNVHRAVGPDFVLNVDDILYFTGLVESFGEFCEEHGLEVVTNEVHEENMMNKSQSGGDSKDDRAENIAKINRMHSTSRDEDEVTERKRIVQFSEHDEVFISPSASGDTSGEPISNDCDHPPPPIDMIDISGNDLGATRESLIHSDTHDRLRSINRMTDMIRGIAPAPDTSTRLEDGTGKASPTIGNAKRKQLPSSSSNLEPDAPPRIVIDIDSSGKSKESLVVVGINARDRPGLLLDISKGLLGLGIQLHHSEASVIEQRSISIWRCEIMPEGVSDVVEIWNVLNALLEHDPGIEAIKRKGLKVLRAIVTRESTLIGKTAAEAGFRLKYKAAIVAVQRDGKNVPSVQSFVFSAGDVLVLQAEEESLLLSQPPQDFYNINQGDDKGSNQLTNLVTNITKRLSRDQLNLLGNMGNISPNKSKENLEKLQRQDSQSKSVTDSSQQQQEQASNEPNDTNNDEEDDFYVASLSESEKDLEAQGSTTGVVEGSADSFQGSSAVSMENMELQEEIWRDLHVRFHTDGPSEGDATSREFLVSMEISPKSQHANKTVAQSGLNKLSGVTLVSIERPVPRSSVPHSTVVRSGRMNVSMASSIVSGASVDETSVAETIARFLPVTQDEALRVGDIIWYAGSANAVGDLRKIPGLQSYESEEVAKINEKVHDRRLVQAVVARKGPLVGKTVKDVRFRTTYGAAIIAVHREGKRVHEHPGKIKLQAGDVLLLEAGPSFISANANNSRAFTLLSEVEDSAPPRLKFLIPALVITIAMLVVVTTRLVKSLLVASLVAVIIMMIIGIISQQEARDAVDWEIYVTIASAFGIGTALTNSGVAKGIADFLVTVGESVGMGSAGLFAAVYLATFLISNVVTNNAAAALIFPIGMEAAEETETDITLMSFCIMLGASASFMSPFGYTTNIMVYGPGGYKYKDFLAIGTPMQFILWILSVYLLSQTDLGISWWVGWAGTGLVLIVVASGKICFSFSDALTCKGPIAKRIFEKRGKEEESEELAMDPKE